MNKLLKNCLTCRHYEWIEDTDSDNNVNWSNSGAVCNKRNGVQNLKSFPFKKEQACHEEGPHTQLFYVGYRELFEKPERQGYTTDITKAGKFTSSEARSMVRYPCADGWARWFIPCSALDTYKDGKLFPKETY